MIHEIVFAELARQAVADAARANLPLLPDAISGALTDVMSQGMPASERQQLARQIRRIVLAAVAEYRLDAAKATEIPS